MPIVFSHLRDMNAPSSLAQQTQADGNGGV